MDRAMQQAGQRQAGLLWAENPIALTVVCSFKRHSAWLTGADGHAAGVSLPTLPFPTLPHPTMPHPYPTPSSMYRMYAYLQLYVQ